MNKLYAKMSNAELEALSNTTLVWYPTSEVARDVFLYFLTLNDSVKKLLLWPKKKQKKKHIFVSYLKTHE